MFLRLLKINYNHVPAGSPEGGQFAGKDAVGSTSEKIPTEAQRLATNYNKRVSVSDVWAGHSPEDRARLQAMESHVKQMYAAGKETYLINTPERVAIRRQILAQVKKDMLAYQAPPGQAPLLTILGGRGGSGKSKLDGLGYNEPGAIKQYPLNSDDIKVALSKAVNHGSWNGAEAGLWHKEADIMTEKLTNWARRNGINVVLDLTLKNDKTASVAIPFKRAGYDLKGSYMFVPPQEAAHRSDMRGLAPGGRYVPTSVIVGDKIDGKQVGGNYNNEKNFDRLLKYFNKGYTVYHNMVKAKEPPVLITDTRNYNPYYKKRKMDFSSVLKFNPNHDPKDGKFSSGGLGNADFNQHDRKIIDLKPGTRPLTDPAQVRTISSIIPGAKYVPYTKLPFFGTMMKMQGTKLESTTGEQQKAARDALLSKQPVESVPLSKLTFTQNVIHEKAMNGFKDISGTKPIQVARYNGNSYLLDGHHRVVFEAKSGTKSLDAHVLNLDKTSKWERIMKFNPNHDPKNGQFSSGDGGGAGQGVEFVSPNVHEGLDVSRAQGALSSTRQQDVLSMAAKVDQILGLRSTHVGAVGAWSDGAENSILGRVYGSPTYDQVRLSAAMKGMLADQKSVIPFKVDSKGPDSLFKIKVSGSDMNAIHDTFVKAGLEYHTMVPHKDHTDVYVLDLGTQLKAKVQEVGSQHGTAISQWKGTGEFLGSWDSRQQGRDAYQAVIAAHLGPDRTGQWDRLYSGWRKTHPVLKGLTVSSIGGILKTEVAWLMTRQQ